MSIIVQDLDGNDVEVFAKMVGECLWSMLRAPDEATFDVVGLSVGLLEQVEGGPVQGLMSDGERITVARLGPMVTTPGTYDDEGNEVTPPVLDERFHVNFWLPPGMVARGLWKKWAIAWSRQGSAVTDRNASEEAIALNGIELIDPDTITTPSNVLAGH